jgi:hypothetical protein
MVASKVTFEVNVVFFNFRRELSVGLVGESSCFLRVASLLVIILKILNGTIKLSFEHADCLNGGLGDVAGKVGVERADIVKVYIEARSLLSYKVVDFLLVFTCAHVVTDDIFHSFFV